MIDVNITIIKSKFDHVPSIFELRTPINVIMFTFRANNFSLCFNLDEVYNILFITYYVSCNKQTNVFR